jgi:hypothetical protein
VVIEAGPHLENVDLFAFDSREDLLHGFRLDLLLHGTDSEGDLPLLDGGMWPCLLVPDVSLHFFVMVAALFFET